tara:strand:- start:2307 stop:2456 length:150 start_codon:yes stop_codon:yes gene_type:complete
MHTWHHIPYPKYTNYSKENALELIFLMQAEEEYKSMLARTLISFKPAQW